VTLAGRYVAGVGAVAMAGLGVMAVAPAGSQPGIAWGLITGLVLQAPLGWWTLRAIGTERFLTLWGLGILVRLAVVAIAAFAVIPALGDAAAPMLVTMVGILVALLLVEGVVAMGEHSREGER
jgi:peptidoglycan biosynthesis protein MviN/MurJ (putative lipid II flippase)